MMGSSKATTTAKYIAELPKDQQGEIKKLNALIRRVAPGLKPGMTAGMLAYGPYPYTGSNGKEGEWFAIGLARQKNYISLYICMVDKGRYVADYYTKALPKASIGKSCVRFKKLEDVDVQALEKMIVHTAKLYKEGKGYLSSTAKKK